MLNRLVHEGYLTRGPEPRRKYVATLRIVALAGQVAENSELVMAARPYLKQLHEETGVSAHLTVPSLMTVLCLLHVGRHTCAARPSIGERVPAHATAAGKALLAMRPHWRAQVLQQPLARFTEATLVERRSLDAELDLIAARGWALEDEEYQRSMRALAAPVRAHNGQVVAALGLSGADESLPLDRCADVGARLAQMAAGMSEAIGCLDVSTQAADRA